jgi:hypothetical protein
MTAFDAVDGSSTGTRVPGCGCRLRLPCRFPAEERTSVVSTHTNQTRRASGALSKSYISRGRLNLMSSIGRFCCKSQLREASKHDSVLLTRIAARSIHDGPSEE